MGLDKNSEIKINKKMRNWNKYKHYIIGGVAILILAILATVIFKSCSKNDTEQQTTESIQITTAASTTATTTAATVAATEATTQATAKSLYTTTKTVTKEEFTQADFYSNSVFFGDALVNGIEYYKLLGPDKVVYDVNLTTDKAIKYVDDVVSYSPSKVFLMLGINDLNYGTRSTATIVENYQTLVNDIHTKLPSAQIYIVSVLPITKSYESKTTVYIKKAGIDDLNTQLKTMAGKSNVNYIDIATAFQDGTGYLDSSVTGNGLNISSTYYGFMLNTIAEMLK